MKCIAIDDEPLALELITDYCSKVNSIELVNTCSNAIDAFEVLRNESIDLMFVDINMPQITGIDFIKSLTKPPLIIFTTAYSEFAADGFELDAIDYLVKPIPFSRFLKAINKATEIYNARKHKYQLPQPPTSTSTDEDEYIFIKVEYSTVKVKLNEIQYVESVKDYVKIVLKGKAKPYLTRTTMKKIDEKLPSSKFVRVHRSFIVSLLAIEKVENNRIIFGEKYIPIGELYKEDLNNILNKNRL